MKEERTEHFDDMSSNGAVVVPDWDDIETLPQPLRKGERKLVHALLRILDHTWTIYVQPYVNGLRPDIVIFSPRHGIAIFEVKEWSLGSYRIFVDPLDPQLTSADKGIPRYEWQFVGGLEPQRIACPFKQVERYRDAIVRFEIPEMKSEVVRNHKFFSVISTFVYFDGHSRDYLEDIPNLVDIEGTYRHGLGEDEIEPAPLRKLLEDRMFFGNRQSSHFANWLQKHAHIIQTTFYPAKYGETDLKFINSKLNPQQAKLLPNDPSNQRRHVFGGAGTGKSFVLVRKAVNAARENKRVLVVVYNITMGNFVRDLIFRLCSYYGEHVHRNVEVCHYHRLMFGPVDEEGMADWSESKADDTADLIDDKSEDQKTPDDKIAAYQGGGFDVLLIDEGQDFLQHWYDDLCEMTKPDAHVMFFEDDRQNIYARSRIQINEKGIRPYYLRATYRIPPHLSRLSNELMRFQELTTESGDIEPLKKEQANPMLRGYGLRWYNAASVESATEALYLDLQALWSLGRLGQPADTVILLCQVEHGYAIDDWLSRNLKLARNRMFETRGEAERLKKQYNVFNKPKTLAERIEFDKNWERYKEAIGNFRRQFKVAYRMRSDGIKLSTIHSFKGWELEQVFILFAPDPDKQEEGEVELLYTAITRSQNYVTVYNTDTRLTHFGEHAIEMNLAETWQPVEY